MESISARDELPDENIREHATAEITKASPPIVGVPDFAAWLST